jgi:uncharacterized membrane protein YeiH
MIPAGVSVLLEHTAVGAAALTGVLAARGKQVDLFGVVVLAIVTALGGGTVRDLLVGDMPVVWVREPQLVGTATGVGLIAFFVARRSNLPIQALLVADAFALALFAVSGARKGLHWGVAPSIAIAMGVITGVAGGIIRDTLTGEIPLVFRRQIYLYATAAFFGATLLVVLMRLGVSEPVCAGSGIGITLLLRLAGIRWKIGLPEFRTPS